MLPFAEVATTVYVIADCAAVGVPEMTQVVLFRLNVSGRAVVPDLMTQDVIDVPLPDKDGGVIDMA